MIDELFYKNRVVLIDDFFVCVCVIFFFFCSTIMHDLVLLEMNSQNAFPSIPKILFYDFFMLAKNLGEVGRGGGGGGGTGGKDRIGGSGCVSSCTVCRKMMLMSPRATEATLEEAKATI